MMLIQLFRCTVAFILFIFSLVKVVDSRNSIPRYRPIARSCGVEHPSSQLEETHRLLKDNENLDNDLWNASMVQERWAEARVSGSLGSRQAMTSIFQIEFWIHIVDDTESAKPSSANYVSGTMISNQIAYLINMFAPTGISFLLAGTTRTTNDTWAANGDDFNMKRTLRKGTYSTLNIYYQSQLRATANTPNVPVNTTLLGFCSLPAAGITKLTSPSTYVNDGCNILSKTMPGGSYGRYNLGGTTAHEVGHWTGLLHTFTGYTCASNDFGDYVADTPQQRESSSTCQVPIDTCPNSGVAEGYNGATGAINPYGPQGYNGTDPIHNVMDYSEDSCYTGFTAGQAARAINIWRLYREGL